MIHAAAVASTRTSAETAQGGANGNTSASQVKNEFARSTTPCHMRRTVPTNDFDQYLQETATSAAEFIRVRLDSPVGRWHYCRKLDRKSLWPTMKTFFLRLFTWWNSQTFGTQVWTALY